MTYKVAMNNRLRLAEYHKPTNEKPPSFEFLIVERRSDDNGDHLLVSDAGTSSETSKSAPKPIREKNTLIGILAGRKGDVETFIYTRHRPNGLSTKGSFFPADGYVQIDRSCDEITLVSSGRHAHQNNATGETEHVPGPVSVLSERASTWHFDAKQISWPAEVLPTA